MTTLRHAFRQLVKSPGFTFVAILTLALGIGLNTAMFNIVNSLALQPLAFPQPDRIFRLQRMTPTLEANGHRPAHFVEIARDVTDVAEMACSRPWSFTLAEKGRAPEVLGSLRASSTYFKVLGVTMELGRDFRPDEDKPGTNQVVILSHKFWQSHFSGDPGIVGKNLRLDGVPVTIVGVAPAIASDPRTVGTPEIYRPLALTTDEIADHVDHAYDIIGRYQPGITAAQAQTKLMAISATLKEIDPTDYTGYSLRIESLDPKLQGGGRQIIFMLIGLSGFVLLIACANLANLLLARAIARAREFSIRSALGASRAQLILPLVAESGLLAIAGGVMGVLICVWTNSWMETEFREAGSEILFVLDWRLLLFAFGISLCTAFFFGVGPAWVVSHTEANDSLKAGARGSTGGRSHNRFRSGLIVGQFALALMLLSQAIFFVRGVDRLLHRDSGWQPTPLMRGILALPSNRYPTTESMMQFYEKVQTRVNALPGVEAATICYEVPAFGFKSGRGFIVEGQSAANANNQLGAPINGVTPGYFNTLGMHLVRGRDFTVADREGAPHVIIVNETMARTLFPGQDAVGRRLAYSDEKQPVWMEIVGIVGDIQFLNLSGRSDRFQTYIPLSQSVWSYVTLTVRTTMLPSTVMDSVRRAVGEIDPDMAIKDLAPVTTFIERSMRDVQAINQLLIGFAMLGLFLAALGIYSVIARLVALRTNEIGIRMALGAQVNQVVRLILATGLRLALIGATLGVAGAIALSRFVGSSLPGIETNMTVGIVTAAVTLLAVALIACYVPARRASKVDPLVALRTE